MFVESLSGASLIRPRQQWGRRTKSEFFERSALVQTAVQDVAVHNKTCINSVQPQRNWANAMLSIDQILDLESYPLDDLENDACRTLVEQCRVEIESIGLFNLDALVQPEALEKCVAEVRAVLDREAYTHSQRHNIYFKSQVDGLADDHPALKTALTSNRKVCADQVPGSILMQIYEWAPLAAFLAAVMDKPQLHVMDDHLASVNVMQYGDGEALNWHFDRSEFTTTLLLQAPDAGGEFEYRLGLRTADDPNYDGIGKFLSGEDSAFERVELSPGTLNVFKGTNTAHRVSPVVGSRERIIAVLCYYEYPGARFSDEDRIRFYGRAA